MNGRQPLVRIFKLVLPTTISKRRINLISGLVQKELQPFFKELNLKIDCVYTSEVNDSNFHLDVLLNDDINTIHDSINLGDLSRRFNGLEYALQKDIHRSITRGLKRLKITRTFPKRDQPLKRTLQFHINIPNLSSWYDDDADIVCDFIMTEVALLLDIPHPPTSLGRSEDKNCYLIVLSNGGTSCRIPLGVLNYDDFDPNTFHQLIHLNRLRKEFEKYGIVEKSDGNKVHTDVESTDNGEICVQQMKVQKKKQVHFIVECKIDKVDNTVISTNYAFAANYSTYLELSQNICRLCNVDQINKIYWMAVDKVLYRICNDETFKEAVFWAEHLDDKNATLQLVVHGTANPIIKVIPEYIT